MMKMKMQMKMKTKLAFLLCFFCALPPPSPAQTLETRALLDFKSRLVDPLHVLESWEESKSPCEFTGVACDAATGLVTVISLENKSLSGEISPSISLLRRLNSLLLPTNSINGTLPDLSALVSLERLDLSENQLSGGFPAWLGNLTQLVSLCLGHNRFDESPIPDQPLGNLKNLTELEFASCNLRGRIPGSIFQLTRLEILDLSDNMITGELPRSISNLQSLKQIELFWNNLTGEIPADLARLKRLEQFDISGNNMHGRLPPGIGELKNLTVFQVYENSFRGEIPPGFGDLERLTAFSIYRNSFSGEFPANFGRFSSLNAIDISENRLSGGFPRFLCGGNNLEKLLALENGFTGELPETYADCKSLVRFRICSNRLSGEIPDGVWALPNANMIDFSDNQFAGRISPAIGSSVSLTQLILNDNRFSGELPGELGRLENLEKIDLSNNILSGEIPSELGRLKHLSSLHLEQNSLTGAVPEELGRCDRLVDLDLARNSLSGHIPTTLSSMDELNSLNLSDNNLTGPIPNGLTQLKLSSIDFSGNRLSGQIPPDLLTAAGSRAFVRNQGLCAAAANSTLRICDGKLGRRGFRGSEMLISIAMLSGLVVVLAASLAWSCKSPETGEAFSDDDDDPERAAEWELRRFHRLELCPKKITRLEEGQLIGTGATGKVYRMEVKTGAVAVKRLWKGDRVKVSGTEMAILGRIRHRNIVKLYACLRKGGSHFLVLEFMANGNLSDALQGRRKAGTAGLEWAQRHRIAVGAAKGVAYLHHDCSPPIIHRDIKSTNILLDEDWEAKIADFGVAKTAASEPQEPSSSCFAGTHGYIAPELGCGARATEKSDVYSFGVVLLELVTGRKAIEEEYGEGKVVVDWVSARLCQGKEDVVEGILDPSLAAEMVREQMMKVLQVAVLCTAKPPSGRPTMRDVVKMLVDADPLAKK